jgi:hypothetical protein
MPEIEALKGLFDLGGVVVVTVMLWIVWRRLNDVTDQLINILGELRVQTLALATRQPPERNRNPVIGSD